MKRILQTARWIGLPALMLLCLGSANSNAAALTLRGDATVGGVAIGESGLPFPVARGDRLDFWLTINSVVTEGGQPELRASFQVTIGGTVLNDSDLSVAISNDRLGSGSLRLADISVVDDPGGYGDKIYFSAIHRTSDHRASGRVGTMESPTFETSIGFLTSFSRLLFPRVYPEILSTESLPLSAEVWNAFSSRQFALDFLPDNSRIGAYINAVTVVPEPAFGPLCAVGAIALHMLTSTLTQSKGIARLKA